MSSFFKYFTKKQETPPLFEDFTKKQEISPLFKNTDRIRPVGPAEPSPVEEPEKKLSIEQLIEQKKYFELFRVCDELESRDLAIAVRKKDIPTLKTLLDSGSRVRGDIALYNAIELGLVEAVKLLLNAGFSYADGVHTAIIYGRAEVLKILLQSGMKASQSNFVDAAYRVHSDQALAVIKVLLETGIVPCDSLLKELAENGRYTIVKFILEFFISQETQ